MVNGDSAEVLLNEREREWLLLEEAIFSILEQHAEIFYGAETLRRYHFAVRQVYSRNLARELDGGLIDLPADQEIITADIVRTRKDDGHWVREERNFFRYEDYLVPIGTYKYQTCPNFYVYDTRSLKPTKLTEFVLGRLPSEIRLTRTLGISEAKIFARGNAAEIGSVHPLSWKDKRVHTAFHDVTNEFAKSGYERLVAFQFDKKELIELVGNGSVKIGTYDFVFKNRSLDSPFPFDMEFVFDKSAFPALMAAYVRWKTKTGYESVINPFYKDEDR